MQRVQFQLGVAKPVPELCHLRAVSIIEVLPRTENLDRRNSGVESAVQQDSRQAMPDVQMGRKNVIHEIRLVTGGLSVRTAVVGSLNDSLVKENRFDQRET